MCIDAWNFSLWCLCFFLACLGVCLSKGSAARFDSFELTELYSLLRRGFMYS